MTERLCTDQEGRPIGECVATVDRLRKDFEFGLTHASYTSSIRLCLHLLDAGRATVRRTDGCCSYGATDNEQRLTDAIQCVSWQHRFNVLAEPLYNGNTFRIQIGNGVGVPITSKDSLPITEFASLFGFPPEAVVAAVEAQRYRVAKSQAYYSIPQLAARLQCSVPQVYKLLRSDNAKVINVGEGSKRKKLLVPADVVNRLEKSRTEKMVAA